METPIPEYFQYKGMMFFLFLAVTLIGILGSYSFPDLQFYIYAFILTYYLFKTTTMGVGMVINYRKGKNILAQRNISNNSSVDQLATHVFIIPSFKENIEILRGTLDFLSKHPLASTYFIFLAMEKR